MPSRKFRKRTQQFKKELTTILGNTVRKPKSVRLGTVDSNGSYLVKVPDNIADEPNEYYFHEVGATSFRGKATLKIENVPHNYLRYGAPIRIQRDILTNRWEIIGLDTTLFNKYFENVALEEVSLFSYENIAIGLVRATTPASLQVVITSGSYATGTTWKYIETLFSVDWGQAPDNANVPSTSGRQRFVLLSIDPELETIVYNYGNEHDIGLSALGALQIDKGNGNHDLMPIPADTNYFRSGYVRLYNGMTQIISTDILPLQDFLGGGGGALQTEIDNIVVADGEVVTAGGNVVIVIV